jgi:hypothetical protein
VGEGSGDMQAPEINMGDLNLFTQNSDAKDPNNVNLDFKITDED